MTTAKKTTGKKKSGRIVAGPVVSCRPEEDGALLFNPDTDTTLLINSTGLIVWQFLKDPHSVEEILAHLLESFTDITDKTSVKRDIEAFLEDLKPDFAGPEGE
jgi:hypothetical protein